MIVQRRSKSTKADASGEALAPPHGGNTHLNIRNYPLGQRNVVSAVGGCIIRVCKLLCSVWQWAYHCTIQHNMHPLATITNLMWPASTMAHINYSARANLSRAAVEKVAQFETNEYIIWERESITDSIQLCAATMTYKIWDSTTSSSAAQ